jgi:hypothetical protein
MPATVEKSDIKFNGSNWQDLDRLVALANFNFIIDTDFTGNHPAQCAYLANSFEGPALDWVSTTYAANNATFAHFGSFVQATREAFGIAENNITAMIRRDLDNLKWDQEVPTFFAEFDRLTLALGITSHETRVAMIEQKLPQSMKLLLANQALSFSNYDTMRERFNCMWAMDPTRGHSVTHKERKPRCGSCGKKGHAAIECRSKN